MICDQRHRFHDVAEHRFADEIVEVDAHPTGLDSFAPAGDLPLELMGGLDVDSEQSVTVRTGARAPTTTLDTEQIVQDRDDEIVVQV